MKPEYKKLIDSCDTADKCFEESKKFYEIESEEETYLSSVLYHKGLMLKAPPDSDPNSERSFFMRAYETEYQILNNLKNQPQVVKDPMISDEKCKEKENRLRQQMEKDDGEFIRKIVMLLSSHLSADDFGRLSEIVDGGEMLEDKIQEEAMKRCPWLFSENKPEVYGRYSPQTE